MITIKRLSAWKYDTSASGGVAIGIVALEGGALYFLDPNGLSHRFRYGGLGVKWTPIVGPKLARAKRESAWVCL